MEEKKIKSKQNRQRTDTEKKEYNPPSLTVYGKLTELTASGSTPSGEGTGVGNRYKMN
jgi:hypothetical protein